MVEHIRVGPEGRILLPATVRRAIGLKPGDIAVVQVEGDHAIVMSREAVRRRLRQMYAHVEGSMADELIAQRHEEVRREGRS